MTIVSALTIVCAATLSPKKQVQDVPIYFSQIHNRPLLLGIFMFIIYCVLSIVLKPH